MAWVFHTSNIINFPQNAMVTMVTDPLAIIYSLQIVCKVLVLSALLANSNAKASTVVSTASSFSTADNAVPTHGGRTAESWKPLFPP